MADNNSRRQFLKSLGIMSLAGSFTTMVCKNREDTNPSPSSLRNILFIIGDDHAATVLGCYKNSIIRTPNLDRLAAKGVMFTNAFANAPVCNASRQSILTGKYPHAAGVTLLRTPFPEEQITIAEHLKQFDFRTGAIGKMHFNNSLPHGFDYRIDAKDYHQHLKNNPPKKPPANLRTRPPWRPFQDPARIWLNADMLPSSHYEKDSEGTYYAQQAIKFLQENRDQRFCLWIGFHEPHSPFNFPIEYTGKYRPEDMPLPQGCPEDDRWIPAVFRDLTDHDKRGIIASYYTSVEYLDKNVGLVLNELEHLQLEDSTLIIYVGDQGYLLGHHKRFEKHTMWEEAVRAPLLMRAGGRYGKDRNIDALCEFVDLAPTILDALGIPPMAEVQGKSLMSLLLGNETEHKSYIFSEFLEDNKAMIRTPEWKYIFTSGKRDLGQGYATGLPAPGITHRLYDLKNDPEETTNVANDPQYSNVLQSLQERMIAHFYQTHPKAKEIRDGLSQEQQLVWFCEPTDEKL